MSRLSTTSSRGFSDPPPLGLARSASQVARDDNQDATSNIRAGTQTTREPVQVPWGRCG